MSDNNVYIVSSTSEAVTIDQPPTVRLHGAVAGRGRPPIFYVGPGAAISKVPPENTAITPLAGTLNFDALLTSVVVSKSVARHTVPWLDSAAFFIPKSIREPFVGDLREDVVEMVAKGHSRESIWWRVCSQIAVLGLRTWLSLRRK